jgi:serine/threonine protein kinase
VIAAGVRLKDRYRLERQLGRGGMASVWLAEDEVLERPVAIKVLSDTISSDPEFLARFRREAHLAAGLSHPNLIGVYDFAEGGERPYLVMEYVPGPNLAERTSEGAKIDCERLARELLGALAHIHAAGIVHRDVKPQNVLIAPDGCAKLIDFGIALPRDATALTRTGNLLGTARYIAPEVMDGRPASEQADLYSCGTVLRECMSADSPRHLRAVVKRLALPDPDGRPASAAAALARLRRRPRFDQANRRPAVERPTEAYRLPLGEADSSGPPRAVRPGRFGWAAAIAAAGAASVTVFLLLAGGDPGERAVSEAGRAVVADGRRDKAPEGEEPAPGAAAPAPTAAAVPEPSGGDPALGSALNQEGFESIQAGDPEAAVPILEEAVRAFPPNTEELDYAYALFNLGNALRLSGRPEEAIPILERRLEIPDQTSTVQEELEMARSESSQ